MQTIYISHVYRVTFQLTHRHDDDDDDDPLFAFEPWESFKQVKSG